MGRNGMVFLCRMGVCLFAVLALAGLGCLFTGSGLVATLGVTLLFAGCCAACLQQISLLKQAGRRLARARRAAVAVPLRDSAA